MNEELIDNRIKELFYRLIAVSPAMIEAKKLYYNLDGQLVSISWFTKREKDVEAAPCSILEKAPFEKCSYRSVGMFSDIFMSHWEIDTSPEIEGYTFYVNTPAGQFRVPELSRRELVDVQEQIEEHYQKFVPNYLSTLLNTPSDKYGQVNKGRGSFDWYAEK